MNYFAKLINNIVIEVICLSETIANGVEWCVEQYGGDWAQTYDNNPAKAFGNIGYTCDAVNDVFVAPPVEPYVEP